MSQFFNRDISWLSFNERVLQEAARENVPLQEKINFLSIYSSNLDEFYRVRIPSLMAFLHFKHYNEKEKEEAATAEQVLQEVNKIILNQQMLYGSIIREVIIPALAKHNQVSIYNTPIPEAIYTETDAYFYTQVLAFLQPVFVSDKQTFFPENNHLYLAVQLERHGKEKTAIVNIPSQELPRFFTVDKNGKHYIVVLDDILRRNLAFIFPSYTILHCYSFKVTRDAELNIADEYSKDIADTIEAQIRKRDLGFATRFLYEPGMHIRALHTLLQYMGLTDANIVTGGRYHNLRDLGGLPVIPFEGSKYATWKPHLPAINSSAVSIFTQLQEKDIVLHVPYEPYDTVLRFFNEAAIDPDVTEVYVTLYRVANDSRIVHSLISAARNGKKVTAFVELKARFDEENNINWAKVMKAAGVKIIYSIPELKVHAKTAMVKRNAGDRVQYFGLLSTGNFNESTARFYTDHILFTTHAGLTRELELLFLFLNYREQAKNFPELQFNELLVAQFNLQGRFLSLIDREINNAQQGKEAHIIIKLNNLEEEVMINKLYEASNAGVKIQLIVRSICRIVPGIDGLSKNITVTRIVDKYLEHGRIFYFHNNGSPDLFMGSSDWMNRNIYHRIEVCFPVYDAGIKQQLIDILHLQLADNVQAVHINAQLQNVPVPSSEPRVRSQEAIWEYVGKIV
ncbi:MAG: polyphosphate kinase 1 [Filimonas sp.]|nr:polyphosphate kinase 1 [Filimonas sp.]